MTITSFRIPDKRKKKIEQEIEDQQMDDLLRREFIEHARELEEEAMTVELDIPKEQMEADAHAMLDQMLSMIHKDPKLDAIAKAPLETAAAATLETEPEIEPEEEDEDMEEVLRLGRALKASGKSLDDILGYHTEPSKGVRRRHVTHRTGFLAGLAASLLIVFTVSFNSSAMRTFLIERLDWNIGENPATTVNADSDLVFSEEREYSEAEALGVIKQNLGIAPLYFSKKPGGMKYDDLYVDPDTQWAKMFYTYQDLVVTVVMDKSDYKMSHAVFYDGKKMEEQEVELDLYNTTASVELIQRDEEHTAYSAEIEYGNAFYNVTGDMKEEEFLELIRNITFG